MDPSITPQGWFNTALGIAAAAAAWIVKRYAGKIDGLETREKNYATRVELEAALEKRDVQLAHMHQQNIDNFRELRLQNETANGRLFDIAKNLTPK